MARDLAIDLGTANTLVYARGQGIVLNEPTVIALNSRTQDVLAMGHEAWQMIGRTPGLHRRRAAAARRRDHRLRHHPAHDPPAARTGPASPGPTGPACSICVPSAITAVERRAVDEAARRAGAAGAYLIEQPMAAAIGAGLPIHEPLGNMIVDVGGGTTETAVISLGGIVALQAVRVGSFDIDAGIQTYVRREYGIAIGERTAEEIKITDRLGLSDRRRVQGRGPRPRSDERTAQDRHPVARGGPRGDRGAGRAPSSTRSIACLGEAPPELAQDLIVQGIHLVGGGGLLRGPRPPPAEETAVPVHLVEAPLEMRRARRRALPRVVRHGPRDVHGPPAALDAAPRLLGRPKLGGRRAGAPVR